MEEIRIAGWESRFWAWLIDIILIWVILGIIERGLAGIIEWTVTFLPILSAGQFWFFFAPIGSTSLVLFLYWTIMEGIHGQSVGKMALNLRLAGRAGDKAGIWKAAISSFGKAFLLPLDCLIGWLAMPGTGLRLTNRISDTIVIRSDYQEPKGVTYIHEDD
ncbi:MAG: RDD family protein [Methanocalculus sp. MSAO_Arc2]|uniref:RDD family protein n=1 Tax=Methanocalculus sp. MSAO_Arc2 TaxID=2293855 RepID=UPI000FF5CDA2|nr:MAG: RDD family protein [Methanocalculus sp. MSAO_Arc2]